MEVKPKLLLPEVVESTIVLISQCRRESQGHVGKPTTRKRYRRIVGRIIECRPSWDKIVRPLSLLEFTDVVLLQTEFPTELHGVLALDPGQVILHDIGGQCLVLPIVAVKRKIGVIYL